MSEKEGDGARVGEDYDLLEKILNAGNLNEAYKRGKSNRPLAKLIFA
jgi:hypothetical protein